MAGRDSRDIIGGGILLASGVGVTVHALMTLGTGTVARMGPGMFPAALGALLAALGLGILIAGLFREGAMPRFDLRAFVLVLGGIVAFVLVFRTFGVVPGIFAMTLVASRADASLSIPRTLVLAAVLSLIAWAIFLAGLDVPLAAFAWPAAAFGG